jgi:hypothetical protein
MKQFEGYANHYDESARLTILRALADQHDFTLNDSVLASVLRDFGFAKGRDYLRTQLRFLADEAGAILLRETFGSMVAEVTEAGLDHVERRRILSGVKRPGPARG